MPVVAPTSSKPRRPRSAAKPVDPARAWAPYEPSSRRPWDLAGAAHLLRRAGFGPKWDELQRALAAGPQRAVDAIVRPKADVDSFNREYDHNEAAVARSGSAEPLRAWWLRRMIDTPHPLLEKITLFWHDFFAASGAKVSRGSTMQQHVQLLRAKAFGSFPKLLSAVANDPAILITLGADTNRKASTNDQFARQLLDRYTVGPGNYSAADVREAARALTGLSVRRFHTSYVDRNHDGGTKTVLGNTGKLTHEDLIRITARHPDTARNIVKRLYRWFISEADEPNNALIAPLAESFAKDFDIAQLVSTMLRSNLFFSPSAYRLRIKRPVEFALSIVRGLEGNVATLALAEHLADLGENLFYPPTTSGWAGGRHWVNRATLIGRANLATALAAGSGEYGGRLDPATTARRHGHADATGAQQFLLDLFIQPDKADGLADTLRKNAPANGDMSHRLRQFADMVVTLPEFQLA